MGGDMQRSNRVNLFLVVVIIGLLVYIGYRFVHHLSIGKVKGAVTQIEPMQAATTATETAAASMTTSTTETTSTMAAIAITTGTVPVQAQTQTQPLMQVERASTTTTSQKVESEKVASEVSTWEKAAAEMAPSSEKVPNAERAPRSAKKH